MIYDKLFQKAIKEVSITTKIPQEVITIAYRSYWEFVRETIEQLPLKEVKTEEDFNKLRTNFNIPGIGKLFLTWDKFCNVKKRGIYLKKLKGEENVEIEKD